MLKLFRSSRLLSLSQDINWQGMLFGLFLLWPSPVMSHEAGDLYREAVAAVEHQHFNKAKLLLEQAIQEFPAFAEAHHLFGLVEFQLTQQPDQAIPALQQAIRLSPNLAQAQYDLALLFIKQSDMQKAQEAAQQALLIYPRFWQARLTLAKLFDQLFLTRQAIQEYRSVLTQQPFQAEALYNLASLYMGTGRIGPGAATAYTTNGTPPPSYRRMVYAWPDRGTTESTLSGFTGIPTRHSGQP